MNTDRPLLCGDFIFQSRQTDYKTLSDEITELDIKITEEVLDWLIRHEVNRKVTLELWTQQQYNSCVREFGISRASKNNPEIRLANFFEVCSFAKENPKAHLVFGEYYGFDSILGRVVLDNYYPYVYGVDDEYEDFIGILTLDKNLDKLPKNCLVVTKTTLLRGSR